MVTDLKSVREVSGEDGTGYSKITWNIGNIALTAGSAGNVIEIFKRVKESLRINGKGISR